MPIRILQISDSLKQRFGITSFLMNYNDYINKERVIFDYLVLDAEDEIVERIKKNGGAIYYMPRMGISNFFNFCEELILFFSSRKYNIVHSHFYQIDPIVSVIAKRHGVHHYISHSHNTRYSDFKLRGIRNYFMSLPIKFFSTDYCACSMAAGKFLFGSKVLRHREKEIIIIPNAIDYEKFTFNPEDRVRIRKKYDIGNNLVFGIVGSLKPQKNHSFVLDVFKEITIKYPSSKLMIVGDGDLKEELTKRSLQYGIRDNVIFVGTSNKPWLYYNAFDCYLFPSIYEGFGLSLLEAEVNGLKCICSTAIPEEPIITTYVKKLPIGNRDIQIWADNAVSFALSGRHFNKIDNSYNLRIQSEKLVKFYEHLK